MPTIDVPAAPTQPHDDALPSTDRTQFPILGAHDATELAAVRAAIAAPALVVQAKGHGHAGTAMAIAPLMHVLYHRILRHDPADPQWPGRDRFILSAGHASLALYTQLMLTGYGLTPADLQASRSLDSRTPGHPELGHTPGIEMSTGPLGQGVASAVGLALAARRDHARHDLQAASDATDNGLRGSDRLSHRNLWDPTVFVLAGDGCLEEGVSAEASSLAGTLGLDNLVLIWDDNRITIDGGTDLAFAEDVRARYRAYGWRVLDIANPTDLDEIESVLREAEHRTGQPTLVALRTEIAAPAPTKKGTSSAHAGALGADEVAGILRALDFAPNAKLTDVVPNDLVAATSEDAIERGRELHQKWQEKYAEWANQNPELAAARDRLLTARRDPAVADDALVAEFPVVEPGETTRAATPDKAAATRSTNGEVIRALHAADLIWGGSADLSSSTSVAVPGEPVSAANPDGDFIPFGIREHAMAAILSGIALHGLWLPYASTYLAFSDYQRPAMRLAALMKLPVVYVYTHDSLAVGEDGPTHQPVEQVAALRTIPGLSVIRPADGAEVIACWRAVLDRNADSATAGPVAFVLSRQELPAITNPGPEISNGGYVVWQHGAGDELALIATGSEVSLALEAAKELAQQGVAVRVVSMPCVEWFAAAPKAWQDAVLPPTLPARVAVEAGRGDAWYRWVGRDGVVVSVEDFGESGSGPEVLKRRGITAENVVRAAQTALAAEAALAAK